MKLGCLTAMFGDMPLEDVLGILRNYELQAIELGTGNYPGSHHVPVAELLQSKPARQEFLAMLKGQGLEISALSCHGNCLHPNQDVANACIEVQTNTIKLAEMLGVSTIIDFSGCPGEGPGATKPNWVTCAWPPDYLDILNWQWNEIALPFWEKRAAFSADHGVKVGFEMHPGFLVYNTETLLKLRNACGNNLGANFDPSHLFWQGMDPIACVRALQDAIFHVHAKDCKVNQYATAVNGVLDTKHYGDELNRSWIFRTCGYGHNEDWWKDFVSTLRMVGYDGTISIEHEDSLMTNREGLEKAVDFFDRVLMYQDKGAMTWA